MTKFTPSHIIRLDRGNLNHLDDQDDVGVDVEQVASAAVVVLRLLGQGKCRIHGSSDTGLWRLFSRHYDDLEYDQSRSLFNAAIAQLQTAGHLLVEAGQQLADGILVDELVTYRLGYAGSSGAAEQNQWRPRGRR